jgi:cytochrome c oxidase subunit 1
MLNERLGKIHFWLWFIGFNLTFAPMHWLGLQGMIRRTWRYHPSLEFWNRLVSIGAFIIALGLLVFIFNWYEEDEEGRPVRRPEADSLVADLQQEGNHPSQPIHLPNQTYFPFVMAAGLPLIGYGIIFHTSAIGKALIVVGVLLSLSALIGWGAEPLEEAHHTPAEAH